MLEVVAETAAETIESAELTETTEGKVDDLSGESPLSIEEADAILDEMMRESLESGDIMDLDIDDSSDLKVNPDKMLEDWIKESSEEQSANETKNAGTENVTENEASSDVAPNTEYEKDGSKYKTDDLGNDYMKDGELIPNNTYKKDGHTYTTNENGDVILKDGEKVKKGGSYKDVIAPGEGSKKEVHHMPSNDSTDLSLGDGPAIKMDKEDHRQTASCGRSREADEYRQKQKELIESGKFREALQMDIDDIREKFGDKYDDAIAEMLEYVDELEKEGKI